MINFKINDKPLQIPTRWEEITFSQYIKIFGLGDDVIQLVSIFTDMEYDYLKKATILGLDKLLTALSFINTPPTMPTYVDQVGPYKLPKNKDGQFNIQYESLGQFEDMRQIMMKVNGDIINHTKAYGKYVAIYLQKIRDNEYDPLKVPELEQEVQKYPALEVITLGAFFFIKLQSSLNGTTKGSLSTPPIQPQKQRGLKGTAKRSAHTRQSSRHR